MLAGGAFIGPNYDFAMAGYTLDGTLDKKFGKKGTLSTPFGPGDTGERIAALLRQPDGMLVAVGGSSAGGGSSTAFAIVRYKTK